MAIKGLQTLYNLILKDVVKGSGQASGIMSIGKDVRKLADKKLQRYVTDAKKQGVDLDSLSEQEIKYMIELNKPKGPQIIPADSPEGKGITEMLLGKRGKVIQADFGKPFAEEVKKFRGPVKEKQDMGDFGKINVEVDYSASLDRPEFFDPKAKNMFGKTVATGSEFIKKERERILNTINRKKKEMVPKTHPNYKLLKKSLQDQEDALEAIKITEDLGGNENMFDFLRTKNISDYKSKPLKKSDYVKTDDPEDFAYGGVAGLLGERQNFAMGRRAFLKLMGSVGAGIGAAKAGLGSLFKAGKPVAKELTQVPIKEGADGMPSWFKPLVNKVIREGTEVESGAERVIVHKTKLPESKTDVYVTQQLDTGDVAVDIGTGKHGFADGYYGQPVRLEYKSGEFIEPVIEGKYKGKVGKKTQEEFNVEEAEFTGGHPENVKFEESTIEKYGNHGSDFSEVERFATGKNVTKDKSGKVKEVETLPTTKKADQLEWARGRAEAEADAAADMADDFASGGVARLLGE